MALSAQIQALMPAAAAARNELGAGNLTLETVPFNGETVSAIVIKFPPMSSLYLLPMGFFPDGPPYAIMNWGDDSEPSLLPLKWNRDLPVCPRLCEALREYVSPPGPFKPVWGPHRGVPCTEDSERGRRAGWKRFLSGGDTAATASSRALHARVESNLHEILKSSSVAIVGLGTVGSYFAEQLSRAGTGRLVCIDDDTVEPSNLSRASYRLEHIGQKKVDAITQLLAQINPLTLVDPIAAKFRDVGQAKLRSVFDTADIIVAATDDPACQVLINRCSFFTGKPAIFAGLYAGAKGGEVHMTVPTITPCFECMLGRRRVAGPAREDGSGLDYGTGRLQGEIALACDIHHVATAGVKLTMSLLAALKSGPQIPLASFALGALTQKSSFLTMGMEPNYWFYDSVFANVLGQYAYQSVWLSTESDSSCCVCGSDGTIEDPFHHIMPSPNLADFKGLDV
jgi:molybdopterin/thiamine biosynthesis adenylyltransferase